MQSAPHIWVFMIMTGVWQTISVGNCILVLLISGIAVRNSKNTAKNTRRSTRRKKQTNRNPDPDRGPGRTTRLRDHYKFGIVMRGNCRFSRFVEIPLLG